jgi:hypothetical protein
MLDQRAGRASRARSRARSGSLLVRWAEGLDSLLSNFVGSADIGPYVAPGDEISARAPIDLNCPSCGQPISQHQRDRTPTMGRLYCP